MREDYSTAASERVFYNFEIIEELDSLYEDIAYKQPLENNTTDNKDISHE
jgi:hypothetical protein